MTVLPVNVDDDLIELLDAQAAESGRSRSEVLAARAEAITTGDDDVHAALDIGVEVLAPRELLTRLGF